MWELIIQRKRESGRKRSNRIESEPRLHHFRVGEWFAERTQKCRSLTSFGMTAYVSYTATMNRVYTHGQATHRFSLNSSGGIASAQDGLAIGQRVRKGQPEGLCEGFGISPTRWMRRS
jgi:outer membrane usher protein FimD/PapC